jgi:hypothetical protein
MVGGRRDDTFKGKGKSKVPALANYRLERGTLKLANDSVVPLARVRAGKGNYAFIDRGGG